MKRILTICGWTFGVWLGSSLVFPLLFPATFPAVSTMRAGGVVHHDTLVLSAPTLAGFVVLGLGLFGVLPGTRGEDDEDKGG